MGYSELPERLREKIRGYYASVWTRHEEARHWMAGLWRTRNAFAAGLRA